MSTGDWRAVHVGPPEQRVVCDKSVLTFSRSGQEVGRGACEDDWRPALVWFFPDAVAFAALRDSYRQSPKRSVHALFAKP